jgi:hypothetical protein
LMLNNSGPSLPRARTSTEPASWDGNATNVERWSTSTSMMSSARKILPIDRLMRRSTMQNHIKIEPLKQPEGEPRVELIKLRASFEPNLEVDPATTVEGEADALTKPSSSTKSLTKTRPANGAPGGHDILVTLSRAELVELQPLVSGWYAIFLVDKPSKQAVEAFVQVGRRHYKESYLDGGFVSAFSEPALHEKGHARLHVKVCKSATTTTCARVVHMHASGEIASS